MLEVNVLKETKKNNFEMDTAKMAMQCIDCHEKNDPGHKIGYL